MFEESLLYGVNQSSQRASISKKQSKRRYKSALRQLLQKLKQGNQTCDSLQTGRAKQPPTSPEPPTGRADEGNQRHTPKPLNLKI